MFIEPKTYKSTMSRKARVTFSYDAEEEDEISLQVGDIITNIVDKDTGWCEGELNGKRGMFPNNFVEEFFSDGEEAVAPKPDSVAGKKGKVTFDYESANEDELTLHVDDVVDILGEDEEGWWKGTLHGTTGVFPSNFVEIFEDTIQTKLMSEEKPENVPHHDKKMLTTSNEDVDQEDGDNKRHSGILPSKKLPGGAVGFGNLINPDMLAKRLNKVHHDEKKEEKNEKMEVEKSTLNKGLKTTKTRPAPPVPVTPQTAQEKHASPLPPEQKKELLVTLEQHSPEKPAVKKPPVKKEKPSLPPKKPLPGRKAEALKKPEKKLDDRESTNEKSKANDDNKEAGDKRLKENAHLKKTSREEDVSQTVTVTPPSDIRTEDVDEGDISFDGIPQTETLNHLTANRAKIPQKRPPSKDGRLTDSTRLSGNLEEQLFNAEQVSPGTLKRSPGRPKEPPKEPAWKREAREARESKVPPATTRKDEPVEKRKSQSGQEVPVPVPSAPKEDAVCSVSPADAEKLNKQIAELREAITNMEKKHNEAIKQLEDKFNREIESLTNDFDEERKQNAALKVEIDRIKRRLARVEGTESK